MEDITPHITNPDTPSSRVSWDNTTLHTLNRRAGRKNLYLPKEMFDETVESWAGIPVIFQEEAIHPDFDAVTKNPDEAASLVGGYVCGTVENPRIEVPGHPRLVVRLSVDDARVRELYDAGELSLSTGFFGTHNHDRLVRPPIPNHVLLFREIVDVQTPFDHGALVHSSHIGIGESEPHIVEDIMAETETSTTPAETQETQETQPVADAPAQDGEAKDEIEALKQELASVKERADKLQGQLEATTHELETTRKELAEYRDAEADRKFNELLNELPEGMTRTDELKHSFREEFEADPIAAALKIARAKNAGGETSPVGERFAHSNVTESNVQRGVGDLSPHARKMNGN